MNYFTDLTTLNFQLIVDVLGDPINSSLSLTANTTGFLSAVVAGQLNQADTQINLKVLDGALGGEQLKLHGNEWYVFAALQAETEITSGSPTISLPNLTQGDEISFGSPLYGLTETSSSIEVLSDIASVIKIAVPSNITDIKIDSSPIYAAAGALATGPITLDLSGAQNVLITGWTASDHLALVEAGQGYSAAIVVTPTSQIGPLSPAAMHLAVLVELGNVAADSAAAVASAADAVYVASTNGADSKGLYFAVQTGNNTAIYAFHGDAHGVVAAADLSHVATLVGVQSIGTADLAIG